MSEINDQMEAQPRGRPRTRDTESRVKAERPKKWMPASLLPDPHPEEGYVFRWIRLSTLGTADPRNISAKLREGWEPVKASEHPEIHAFGSEANPRFPDSIEIGGLLLCKTPKEFADQYAEHFRQQADANMQSVDNSFMRENDPRMPLFKERRSEVSFGRGS
jgi:hypothetical protein